MFLLSLVITYFLNHIAELSLLWQYKGIGYVPMAPVDIFFVFQRLSFFHRSPLWYVRGPVLFLGRAYVCLCVWGLSPGSPTRPERLFYPSPYTSLSVGWSSDLFHDFKFLNIIAKRGIFQQFVLYLDAGKWGQGKLKNLGIEGKYLWMGD